MELSHHSNRRWLLAVAALAGATLVLTAVFLTVAIVRYSNAADYPGAASSGGKDLIKVWPHLAIRRDSSYRTPDPLPRVYKWYSTGFSLGPESYALSNCIQIAKSFTDFYVVERDMSVTICDTPSGRMIFVMRSLTLRLPS
jgi:hypothetical protein